jgi:hypothetical protein
MYFPHKKNLVSLKNNERKCHRTVVEIVYL